MSTKEKESNRLEEINALIERKKDLIDKVQRELEGLIAERDRVLSISNYEKPERTRTVYFSEVPEGSEFYTYTEYNPANMAIGLKYKKINPEEGKINQLVVHETKDLSLGKTQIFHHHTKVLLIEK